MCRRSQVLTAKLLVGNLKVSACPSNPPVGVWKKLFETLGSFIWKVLRQSSCWTPECPIVLKFERFGSCSVLCLKCSVSQTPWLYSGNVLFPDVETTMRKGPANQPQCDRNADDDVVWTNRSHFRCLPSFPSSCQTGVLSFHLLWRHGIDEVKGFRGSPRQSLHDKDLRRKESALQELNFGRNLRCGGKFVACSIAGSKIPSPKPQTQGKTAPEADTKFSYFFVFFRIFSHFLRTVLKK